MVTIVEAFLLVGTLAGGALCWFGYRVYRLSDRLGRRAFVGFAAALGVGTVVTGVVGVVPLPFDVGPRESFWAQIPLLFWLLSTFPWFVFAVQYTGTRTRIRRRTLGVMALPYAFIVLQIGLSALDISITLLSILGSAVFIYTISIVAGGAYLLLQSTYAAGHLSIGQGASLALAPIGSLTVWNVMSTSAGTSAAGSAGAFAAGSCLAALALGAARLRYDLFESTPSIDTLGERALTRETDDLMFVVDGDDRIIRINETAVDTLGVRESDVLGEPLSGVIDHDTDALREAETVPVGSARGTRQYDPQVSTVGDHHGNDLGAMLSLRDVTERELREQRLAVLNRVLRHNLRNQADVVRGHAESLDADGDRVGAIIDAADAIAALGQQARRIDQYVSESPDNVAVDLPATVDRVIDTIGGAEADVSVTVDVPASARVVTNEQALVSCLESAVENAITYADSAVTVIVEERPDAVVIRVADDGPGIPEWELDSLDAATETALQHSTGIGLWQLKWGVIALNGELSFDTDGGTTVEIVVPNREDTRAAAG